MAFINDPAPEAAASPEAATAAAQDSAQTEPAGGDGRPGPEVPAEALNCSPNGWASGGGLERDAEHMRRALGLAAKGLGRTRPNPAVGCVIVDSEGQVVGEGFHPRAGEPHAEVWAIRQAGDRAKGGTAYVTLEPCNHFGRTPPCTSALLNSGVSRVVAGMVDPDPRTAGSGLRRLADEGLDVTVGVEGAACQALNCAFVHRVSEKSCYGVLHCSLDGSGSLELEDTANEPELTMMSDCHTYNEYDAIVVEGRSGVAKLTACLQAIPPTVLRVVLVSSGEGIDEELGPVSESALWTDLPEHTIIVAARASNTKGDDDAPGSVRASLTARGVTIVDFSVHEQPASRPEPHDSLAAAEAGAAAAKAEPGAAAVGEEAGTSAADTAVAEAEAGVAAAAAEAGTAAADTADVAATAAVAKELYRRGLLSAAWDVGPAIAARALQDGHIQRTLVRRRRAEGSGEGDEGHEKRGGEGERSTSSTPPQVASGGKEEEEEEAAALRAMASLCGKEGVCVRRDGAVHRGVGEKSYTSVLLPVAPFRPSAE